MKCPTAWQESAGRMKLAHAIHDDNSLEGSTSTQYMDETISGRSIKKKCRHNTDWRGCSSFDSGAHFHGRFTVPFAWLIEACLSRNTSQLSHGTSELHRAGRREAGENCTLLICSFWLKCFYNSLKAPLFARRGGVKFESSCLRALVFICANLDQYFSLALRNLTLQQ